MKKILLFVISLLFIGVSFAGEIASFSVVPNPSTVKSGEPFDVTIKALDENGDVVDDYDNIIQITVEDKNGNELDEDEVVLPEDGSYTFSEEDQGEKTFVKGFTINKEGDYTIKVTDFSSDDITGEGNVKVVAKGSANQSGEVIIQSPKDGEQVTSDVLSVIGRADKYRNSKIQVVIDDNVAADGQIDDAGTFQVDVQNVEDGEHTLLVKVLDIDDNVVATSKKVNISVKLNNELFKGIELLPSETVNEGTRVTIKVKVDPSVSAVTAKVASYGDFPMDKTSQDTFTANFLANKPGKFDISLDITGPHGNETKSKVKQLVVIEKIAITSVRFKRDNIKKTIALDWKFKGQVPAFKVKYSTNKDNLDLEANVTENTYTITNIDETKTYFAQIIPTDTDGNKIGDESKVIVIEPNMKQSAATCVIDNIKVDVVKKGKTNYLTWKDVDGALKYNIYRGKTVTDMTLISTTTGTSYELPFNAKAKKVEYAYFTVKAVCDDGNEKQIDKAKKVKVGPLDWLLYALIATMIVYGIRLSYSKN